MRDGAHIYNGDGTPYIIDFGFFRYVLIYIDMGQFTPNNIQTCYKELLFRCILLKYKDFEERVRTAFRYNGFAYLYPSVMD